MYCAVFVNVYAEENSVYPELRVLDEVGNILGETGLLMLEYKSL